MVEKIRSWVGEEWHQIKIQEKGKARNVRYFTYGDGSIPLFLTGMATHYLPIIKKWFEEDPELWNQFTIVGCDFAFTETNDYTQKETQDFTLDDLAAQIEALREALFAQDPKFEKIAVMGHSVPAAITAAYVANYPECTRFGWLFSTVVKWKEGFPQLDRDENSYYRKNTTKKQQEKVDAALAAVPPRAPDGIKNPGRWSWYKQNQDLFWLDPTQNNTNLDHGKEMQEDIWDCHVVNPWFVDQFFNEIMKGYDIRSLFEKINRQTAPPPVSVFGGHDPQYPITNVMKREETRKGWKYLGEEEQAVPQASKLRSSARLRDQHGHYRLSKEEYHALLCEWERKAEAVQKADRHWPASWEAKYDVKESAHWPFLREGKKSDFYQWVREIVIPAATISMVETQLDDKEGFGNCEVLPLNVGKRKVGA